MNNVNVSAIQAYDSKQASKEILEVVCDKLSQYLEYLGLPHENILVEVKQRQRAIVNIQEIIPDLSLKQKESAFYLSKFISASMMGLFDAALNYLWDETIQNLRKKIVIFDIDYFYDTAIKDTKKRLKFQGEQDLLKLDDWELVSGCEETGIITQLGYKHLDYIRDMRNHASAAHPNHNEITGLQLASWLETCIKEVIGKEPEGAVIEVKKLLKSLREETLLVNDIFPITEGISKLPKDLAHSLLRTIFGMYTDINIAANTRNNINFVAPKIWGVSTEEMRYEIGLKSSSFEMNGEIYRKKLASDFLENVQGSSYLADDTLALKLNEALEALLVAHNSWNNFHNEPTPAKLVKSFVPSSGKIPKSSVVNYIKVLIICRIGNEHGVSNAAQEIYDDLIAKLSNDEAKCLIQLFNEDSKLRSKLQFDSCKKQLKDVISVIYSNTTDKLIKDMLDFIKNFPNISFDSIRNDRRFKQKLAALKL